MRNNHDIEQIRLMVRSVAESCALMVKKVADLAEHLDPDSAGAAGRDLREDLLGGGPVDAEAIFGQLIIDPAGRRLPSEAAPAAEGSDERIGNKEIANSIFLSVAKGQATKDDVAAYFRKLMNE